MIDVALEEVLEQFCVYNCPFVLQDPELFDRLLHFIHALMVRAAREERAANVSVKPSAN